MNLEHAASNGAQVDPRRLKFITERLAALQGLGSPIFLGVILLLTSTEGLWHNLWWLNLLNLAFLVLTFRLMPKYYERRFGLVEPKNSTNPMNRREAIGCLAAILLFVVLLIWGRRLEVWADAILGGPSGKIQLIALLAWGVGLYRSVREQLEGTDPRGPYFFVVGLAASAAVCFFPKLHPAATQSMLWKTLNAGSWGLTLIAWGLRDHFTLVRLLPKNGSDDEDEC